MKTLRRLCRSSKDWIDHIEQCNLRNDGKHVAVIGATIVQDIDTQIPPLPLIAVSFYNSGRPTQERKGLRVIKVSGGNWTHIIFGMSDAVKMAEVIKEMKEKEIQGQGTNEDLGIVERLEEDATGS